VLILKYLFIERGAKRLGGGSRCNLTIMDILKEAGNTVYYYDICNDLYQVFTDKRDIPKFYPLLHFDPADFEDGTEPQKVIDAPDFFKAMHEVLPISERLRKLCDDADVIFSGTDYLNHTLAVLYPGKFITYLHCAPVTAPGTADYIKDGLSGCRRIISNSIHTYLTAKYKVGLDTELVQPPVNPVFYDDSVPFLERKYDILFMGRIAEDKLTGWNFREFEGFVQERGYSCNIIGSLWTHISNKSVDGKEFKQADTSYKLGEGAGGTTPYVFDTSINIVPNADFQQIKHYLSQSRIYIHTKKTEDFGQSIVEAALSGCICFVPDTEFNFLDIPGVIRYKNMDELKLQIMLSLQPEVVEYWEKNTKPKLKMQLQKLYDDSKDAVLKWIK
jgi:glycosyltransferase involved in cell wall biosynthesis